MDILITNELLNILMIAMTFSFILMAVTQKVKTSGLINKKYQVFIVNLFMAFIIGIPFAINFYNLNIKMAIWVSIFGFIGAPGIYTILKKQNIINYTPKSLTNSVTISQENIINRNTNNN